MYGLFAKFNIEQVNLVSALNSTYKENWKFSLVDIAFDNDYCRPKPLYRHLKEIYNITPKAYLKFWQFVERLNFVGLCSI